jgi:hypothetical protein
MSKRVVSALIVASFIIIVGRCSVTSKNPGVGHDTPSSNTIEFDVFADTDETIQHPPPPEGFFDPCNAGTLTCPLGGLVQLSETPDGNASCPADGGIGEGCSAPCLDCSARNLDQAVDQFLNDPAFQDEEDLPDLTQEQALKKCFKIAQYVKYKKDEFDCRHFAYYTKACIRRFFNSAWTASIYCKNCSRRDLYPDGTIGHVIVGYYSSELGKCCMAEPSASYPEAAVVCQDAARQSDCDWPGLLRDAKAKYCSGDWYGDPQRKRDCVTWPEATGWQNDRVTCDRATQKCLVDNDILPQKQCVGSYRCQNGQWFLQLSDATQCDPGSSCLSQLPLTNGPCSTAGAGTTFNAPCP